MAGVKRHRPAADLHSIPSLDLVLRSAVGHLVVVSAIPACALVVAIAAATAAGRRNGGYPDGLAGQEISLAARIVAVAAAEECHVHPDVADLAGTKPASG
jgi:hypothetical protein